VTITVRLEPQIETSLLARARARGMTLDAYVQSLIEGAAAESESPMSMEEFDAALDELARDSEQLPVLPPEADSRQGIYGNG